MEMVRLKCGFENRIDIGAVGSRGGLSLGWKGNSLVSFRSFSSFHIGFEIHDNEYPSDETLAKITNVQVGLNLEADKEELFWEQRARVNWLKNGDRNTSYFHKIAVQHQLRGRISELDNGNGRRISSTEEILKLAADYFSNLFSAFEMGSDEHVFELVEKIVTESMNDFLIKQFTEEDIESAVKMMAPLNVLRVDGFPAIFFQR
ncbi:hypothetical protein V6Z12_D07G023200 [Gossypium hirsutum]